MFNTSSSCSWVTIACPSQPFFLLVWFPRKGNLRRNNHFLISDKLRSWRIMAPHFEYRTWRKSHGWRNPGGLRSSRVQKESDARWRTISFPFNTWRKKMTATNVLFQIPQDDRTSLGSASLRIHRMDDKRLNSNETQVPNPTVWMQKRFFIFPL